MGQITFGATLLRFDLIGAWKAGIKEHPSIVLKELGIKVLDWHGVPMADCIMIWTDTKLPDRLPEYLIKVPEGDRSKDLFAYKE